MNTMNTMNDKSKKIIALSERDHVMKRATMYVGQVEQTDLKVPMVETGADNKPLIKKREIYFSPAFYKLYDEVLGNAFDEAIRMGGKMKRIEIHFNSKTSEVEVIDTGNGFYEGTELNESTERTNIETAFTILRAGSNFDDDREVEVIGTNGVGVSLVNMLSERFEVNTVADRVVDGKNIRERYTQIWSAESWDNDELVEPTITKVPKKTPLGTSVKYIPLKNMFKGNVWDKEYLHTLMLYKNFTKRQTPLLENVDFEAYFDGVKLDLNIPLIPDNAFLVESRIGKIWVWNNEKDSTSVSFINGQLCEGSHQRVIEENINDIVFKWDKAHWFYESLVLLNLKPNIVRFSDQNKTKFATGKWQIKEVLDKAFNNKIKALGSHKAIFKEVQNKIKDYESKNSLKELKQKKRKVDTNKLVKKYFPPSKRKEVIFITEGLSASGGIVETRDSETHGVYALRGKIKNVRTVKDLSESDEIVNILNVLGLDLDKQTCDYDKVIITTDADPDGLGHILPLLINLFFRFFPTLIDESRILFLRTPIITAKINNKLEHFYTQEDFYNLKTTKISEKAYIKGLGALTKEDWEKIFNDMFLDVFYNDRSAKKMLDVAFGESSKLRKLWLENKL